MSVNSEAVLSSGPVAASRGLRWCMDGLHLWRRAPFKYFFMYLSILVVIGIIENIPWVGSWTLHILVLGMLQFGILLGLHDLAAGKPLRWAHLLGCFRRGRFWLSLALVALCGFVLFGIVQLVVWAAYGRAGFDVMWLGQRTSHIALLTPRLQEIASLTGTSLGVLLILPPCLLLFDGLSPWRAFVRGIGMVLRLTAPFAVFLLVNLVVVLIGSSTPWLIPLSLIFGMPWMTACMYAVWHDLRYARPVIPAKG